MDGSGQANGPRPAVAETAPLYATAYGLQMRPFALASDSGAIYWSDAHRRAASVLEYGLMSAAPVTLLTGEIGTGKTVLVQSFLARLRSGALGAGYRAVPVEPGPGGRRAILAAVLAALGRPLPALADDEIGDLTLSLELQRAVLAERAAGRRLVIVVDEAQSLSDAALEALRQLTNIAAEPATVQLTLIGQPELAARLRRSELRALAQRVVARGELGPMSA